MAESKANNKDCSRGIQNTVRIENLTAELGELKMEIKEAKLEFNNAVKEIREKLLGRPTWGVTVVLTTLASALVGMGMYIITHT